jgi:hypothetical protein
LPGGNLFLFFKSAMCGASSAARIFC